MQVKTVLSRVQGFVGFVYQDVRLCLDSQSHAERI